LFFSVVSSVLLGVVASVEDIKVFKDFNISPGKHTIFRQKQISRNEYFNFPKNKVNKVEVIMWPGFVLRFGFLKK